MTSRHLTYVLATMTLGACAPMEQVPLVYTSKVLGGAHVEAGTPENPGLAVNLGFKGLDAAFVPVAVAKWCQDGADCEDAIYKHEMVFGTSDEDTDSPLNQELQAVAVQIALLEKEKREAQAKLDELIALKNSNENRRREREAFTKTISDLNAKPMPLDGEDTARLASAQSELAAIDALEDSAAITARMKAPSEAIPQLTKSLALAEARQKELHIAKQLARKDNKRDAYSVYGSFDGAAEGQGEGASLALGKVFSTGVAAQNLTQGIKQAALANSQASCLRAVEEAAKQAEADNAALAAKLRERKTSCLD